jgi:tRNA1Val (adenine37-N6)-methyltransferase
MANNYFKFKEFTVWQQHCAMKVGTDGTLLGAWAEGGERILDVGTGTGLIALMMAQRFPQARVMGIDIDSQAVGQARENVEASPFAQRVVIERADANMFEGTFDCVVSNPPFFEKSMICPDGQRTTARHDENFSYAGLFSLGRRVLTEEGCLSLVAPFDYRSRVLEEASLHGFFLRREWAVKTTPKKQPRRYLFTFALSSAADIDRGTGVIEDAPGQRSEWYQQLTADFYL